MLIINMNIKEVFMKNVALKFSLIVAGSAGFMLLNPKTREVLKSVSKTIKKSKNEEIRENIHPEKLNFC